MNWTGPPLVGRTKELEAFQAALDRSIEGTGGILILAGEAGIGKSFLAHMFQTTARERGVRVIWGRCFEGRWQRGRRARPGRDPRAPGLAHHPAGAVGTGTKAVGREPFIVQPYSGVTPGDWNGYRSIGSTGRAGGDP